jgi:hypothetical protein
MSALCDFLTKVVNLLPGHDLSCFCLISKYWHFYVNKYAKDKRTRLSFISWAILYYRMDIVEKLRSLGYEWSKSCLYNAIGTGNLTLLMTTKKDGMEFDHHLTSFASRNGQMTILMWLQKNDVPFDSYVIGHAALGGYLDIIKWAQKKGMLLGR